VKDKDRIADKEQAEGSRETVNAALQQRKDLQQGVTNRPVVEERNQQEKLPSRNENQEQDESTDTPTSQSSAGKTGLRSGAKKHATANRGGIAPGKARPKAGARGMADRRSGTARANRGATRTAVIDGAKKPKAKPTARSRSRRRAA